MLLEFSKKKFHSSNLLRCRSLDCYLIFYIGSQLIDYYQSLNLDLLDVLLILKWLLILSYYMQFSRYKVILLMKSIKLLGLRRLELPTSRLSGVRSNQLSYRPLIWQPPTLPCRLQHSTIGRLGLNHRVRDGNGCYP